MDHWFSGEDPFLVTMDIRNGELAKLKEEAENSLLKDDGIRFEAHKKIVLDYIYARIKKMENITHQLMAKEKLKKELRCQPRLFLPTKLQKELIATRKQSNDACTRRWNSWNDCKAGEKGRPGLGSHRRERRRKLNFCETNPN